MQPFAYADPTALDEACGLLYEHEGRAKVMAGGVALLTLMRNGFLAPELVVNIKGVPGLGEIRYDPAAGLSIGGLVTHRTLERSAVLRQHFPALAEMAAHVGSVQIRNRGTLAGNLAHAEPAADPPTLLVALGARVRLHGHGGSRELALEDFLVGYYETRLEPDEIISEIRLPAPRPHTGAAYTKFVTRGAMDMCLLGAAASLELDPRDGVCRAARLAVGNMGAGPLRAGAAEAALVGERLTPDVIRRAAGLAARGLSPVNDTRGSAEYRLAMAPVAAARTLQQAARRAASGQ